MLEYEGGAMGGDCVMRAKLSQMGLVPLYKTSREIPCPLHYVKTQGENSSPGSGHSPDAKSTGDMISGFPAYRTCMD